MQGKLKRNLLVESEKAFVGTVCVDMGFFCGTVFLQAEFCCDIMKKTRNKAIDEEIKYFPIFPNLSHAQNMKYFVQIESRGLPSGGVLGQSPKVLKEVKIWRF